MPKRYSEAANKKEEPCPTDMAQSTLTPLDIAQAKVDLHRMRREERLSPGATTFGTQSWQEQVIAPELTRDEQAAIQRASYAHIGILDEIIENADAESALAALSGQQKQHAVTTKTSGKSKSQRCAEDTEKILKELSMLRANIQIPEDYDRFQSANADYLIFKVVKAAKGELGLRERLINLPSRKGRLIGLAQEFASALHVRALSTVKTDWKKRARPKTAKASAR